MIQLLMMAAMMTQQPSVARTPVTTCQWPNPCVAEVQQARPVTTCQWPNPCAADEPIITTCQYPNSCS